MINPEVDFGHLQCHTDMASIYLNFRIYLNPDPNLSSLAVQLSWWT